MATARIGISNSGGRSSRYIADHEWMNPRQSTTLPTLEASITDNNIFIAPKRQKAYDNNRVLYPEAQQKETPPRSLIAQRDVFLCGAGINRCLVRPDCRCGGKYLPMGAKNMDTHNISHLPSRSPGCRPGRRSPRSGARAPEAQCRLFHFTISRRLLVRFLIAIE